MALKATADKIFERSTGGENLDAWLRRERDDHDRSFEQMSRDIAVFTQGEISVSATTVRNWVSLLEPAA